jgi:hypothetical protein
MNKSDNKKRTVEIYFILYLAALLFLLPDGKHKQNASKPDSYQFTSQSAFNIYSEKTTLNAKMIFDSNGARIVALDSANAIFYSGDVKDLSCEFTIFDNQLNQSVRISQNEQNKYFRIVENKSNKSIIFYWKPSGSETSNKSYIVQVNARARYNNSASELLQAKTQFSLNIEFVNSSIMDLNRGINSSGIPLAMNQLFDSLRRGESLYNSSIASGDFDLAPEKSLLTDQAYRKWTNIVSAYNINLLKDLKGKPEISVEAGDSKYKDLNVDLRADKIIISGKIPPYGKINVRVKLTRKSDSKERSITFSVKPLQLGAPQYSKIMYPGRSYWIDPELPITDIETSAQLRDNQRIRVRSSQGEKFKFTPDISDTGKILMLERFIDNSQIGEELPIKVMPYPSPEIIDIQENKRGEVIIKTKSFGSAAGEKNLTNDFELSGNAQYRELYGKLEEDRENFQHIQTFVFTPKRSGDKFEFTIRAVDKSGKKSKSRSFSQD